MPDFAEVYHLRLTEVVETWDPVEAVLLVHGLPATSRYAARLAGDPVGHGWDVVDWLALDTRNAVEGLRATVVAIASGKKGKAHFREWTDYPGREAQRIKRRERGLANLRARATDLTE